MLIFSPCRSRGRRRRVRRLAPGVAASGPAGPNGADDVSRSVHTSIAVSLIGGFVVMILGLVFCEPLLVMMGTPGNILDFSVLYMRIYFLSMPASMVFNFGAAILRAVGDTRRPMYFLIVTGILHVAFSLFSVMILRMSVGGVAWATVISQYLSVLLIMLSLSRCDGAIRFIPRKMEIDRQKLKVIVQIGLPAGLQSLLFSISNVLIQSAVNSFGSTMVAANAAASNLENYLYTTTNAYYTAAVTFTAQSMGAKKYDRIDTVAKVCAALVLATWILLGGTAVLFGRPLLGIFTDVIGMGVLRLYVIMIGFFACGIMDVYPGLSRGMGYSVSPMLCTLVGVCLLRIVWLATFFARYPTEVVLFAAYPVTWALTGIGQTIIFFYARRQIRKQAA